MKLTDWQLAILVFVVTLIVIVRVLHDLAIAKGYINIKNYLRAILGKPDPVELIINMIIETPYEQLPTEKSRTLKVVFEYEMEINNGGHHQYFWNSSGDNYLQLQKALQQIGAHKTLLTFNNTLKALGVVPSINRVKRQKQMEVALKSLKQHTTTTFVIEDSLIHENTELPYCYRKYISENISELNKSLVETSDNIPR